MIKVKTIAVQLAESAGAVFGLRWGTEEPAFAVVDRMGDIEVRRYGPRIGVQTCVRSDDEIARNIGFRRLARYIFGANRGAKQIAMTAPVAQLPGERIESAAPVAQTPGETGQSVIQFFMPSRWTLATLPEPDDAEIRIVEVPAEVCAVLRFSGDRSATEVRRRGDALLNALRDSRYEVTAAPIAWFYDPPFTLPFRRRNEVVVPVREGAGT